MLRTRIVVVVHFLLCSFKVVVLPALRSAGLGTAILQYVLPKNTTKSICNPSTQARFANQLEAGISGSHPVTPISKAGCFVIHKQSFPPPTYFPKMMKTQSSVKASLPFLFCSSLSDHAGVFFNSNCSRGESIPK